MPTPQRITKNPIEVGTCFSREADGPLQWWAWEIRILRTGGREAEISRTYLKIDRDSERFRRLNSDAPSDLAGREKKLWWPHAEGVERRPSEPG